MTPTPLVMILHPKDSGNGLNSGTKENLINWPGLFPASVLNLRKSCTFLSEWQKLKMKRYCETLLMPNLAGYGL
jgi:hypothetical protein